MPTAIDRRDVLGVTLIAERHLDVRAHDLSSGAPEGVELVTLHLGPIDILGTNDEIRYLFTRAIGECDRVDAGRALAAEQACADGTHSHPLSVIEDLGGGRTAVECLACDREFVQEGDGTLVPVVNGLAVAS